MAKSHLPPLVNQEVETSQASERLSFENVLLCMVVIEIVAQTVNSAFVVAAASRESGFSEVDVENTAMTGQKKPDAAAAVAYFAYAVVIVP